MHVNRRAAKQTRWEAVTSTCHRLSYCQSLPDGPRTPSFPVNPVGPGFPFTGFGQMFSMQEMLTVSPKKKNKIKIEIQN